MIARTLSNLLGFLSLLLCVIAGAFWVHSYIVGDALSWARESLSGRRFEYHTLDAFSVRGGLWISYGYYRRDLSEAQASGQLLRPATIGTSHFDYPVYPAPQGDIPLTLANLMGFRLGHNGGTDPVMGTMNSTWGVVIPWWFFVALFGIPPGWLMWRRLRQKPSRCPGCGYDLRATPHRCPECGTVTKS